MPELTVEERVTNLEAQQTSNASKAQFQTVSEKVGAKYTELSNAITALRNENTLLKAQIADLLSRVAALEE